MTTWHEVRRWCLALLVGAGVGLACGYDTSPPQEHLEAPDAGATPPDGMTDGGEGGGATDGGAMDGGATDGGATDGGTSPDRPDAGPGPGVDGGPPTACTSPVGCDDQNPCTADTCSEQGLCAHAAVDGGCTVGGRTGTCVSGQCCIGVQCT